MTIRWTTWHHGILAATVAVLVVTTACAGGPSTPGASGTPPSTTPPRRALDATISHKLDTAIDDAMRANGIPGAIVGIWSPDGD